MAVWMAAVLLLLAEPAHATFPGANGRLAFTSGDVQILMMNADGGGLTFPPLEFPSGPAWSPDGEKLAFHSETFLGYPGDLTPSEIYVADPDLSNPKDLTNTPDLGETDQAWSPDGNGIMFVGYGPDRRPDLYVMNADGGGRRLIRAGFEGGDLEWSPDGTKIVFERDFDIWVMNPDGTQAHNLTNFAPAPSPYEPRANAHSPSWSPDGRRIVFAVNPPDPQLRNFFELYLVNADGSGLVNLTRTELVDENWPVWSPDGTKIAFVDGKPPYGVFTITPDGRDRTTLTVGINPSGGSWEPIVPKPGDFKNTARFCKQEQKRLGAVFTSRYGTNGNGANALGQCVKQGL
jgi:Tol biopolymer transport system component